MERTSPDFDEPVPPAGAPPAEDWNARVEQLLAEAEAAPSGNVRAACLCRLAEIYERQLGDPNSALLTLQAALEEDPTSGRVIQEMERVARSNGFWAQIVAATAEVAGGLVDRKRAADLWVQVAFWNDTGLLMLDAAAQAAETALGLDPGHGGALALLEEIYRRQRSWDRYVEVLDRKRGTPGADAGKLIAAYREVLRYDARHVGAQGGLAQLLEDGADWPAAAEALRRLVESLPAGAAVGARHRLARVLKDHLGDVRGAEEQLALGLASLGGETHVPSLLLLASIYRERKDWLKARQLLGRAAVAVTERDERVRLLAEAAEICSTQLDDEAQAADLYSEILALDGTRVDLAEKLAEIRFQRGDFIALLPLAERLARASESQPPEARARIFYWLGRARGAAGDETGAVEAYRTAVAAGGGEVGARAAVRQLAALNFERGDWEAAAEAYDALLAAGPSLAADEQLTALERLGQARLRAGHPAAAIEPLEKVLALEPRRRGALETLMQAARAAGDDDVVLRHTQALVAATEDPKTKLELLEHLASIHRDRRKDPERAIAAYLEALEIWPDERSIMHRLLELLTETKQWQRAVQLLARLAELTSPHERGPYYVAAGNILMDELGASGEAIEAFERALDADPGDLKSFEQIVRLVVAARDWKTQERTYRRQIKRLGAEASPERRPILLALWQGLGEIYRTRLLDIPAAIAAFEVACGLDPESSERRRVLAELYRLAGPETFPKAVAEHRALVGRARTVPEMVPELKTLVRLFVEMGSLDEAHAVASALTVFGAADPDEQSLYRQYRPNGVVRAHARMTEEVWLKQVYHPEEDRTLSQILATLSPAVASARAQPAKELGLKRKHRRELATDSSTITKVLAYGAAVLGALPPEVYVVPDALGEIDVFNVRGVLPGTPALVVGQGLMQGRSDVELAFIVGRTLASIRPDHLLRWPRFVPTVGELEIVVRAAIRLYTPNSVVPAELASAVGQYAAFLERTLSPQAAEQLKVLVRRFDSAAMAEGPPTGGRLDLLRWSRAACLTTIRAGLLLAGDLEVALRLGQIPAAAAGIEIGDLVRDLGAWSVSEGYAELRTQLGLRTVQLGLRG